MPRIEGIGEDKYRQGAIGIREYDMKEEWFCCLLSETPEIQPEYTVGNAFYTEIERITRAPHVNQRAFTFGGVESWYQVGLQISAASGWRPDLVRPQWRNIAQTLPPRNSGGRIVVRSQEQMRWLKEGAEQGETPSKGATKGGGAVGRGRMRVVAGILMKNGTGATCSWRRTTKGRVATQGRIVGKAEKRGSPLACMDLLGLVHALDLVLQYLKNESERTVECVQIKFGNAWLAQVLLE